MICNFTIPTMAGSQVSKNEVGAVGDVKLPIEPHTHRDWPLYATLQRKYGSHREWTTVGSKGAAGAWPDALWWTMNGAYQLRCNYELF